MAAQNIASDRLTSFSAACFSRTRRALPLIRDEGYLPPADVPAAESVLKAAAWTYVAAALISLIDVTRWIRVLR